MLDSTLPFCHGLRYAVLAGRMPSDFIIGDNPSAEDGVAVENEVVRGGVVWERLAKLLDDPGCRGVLGDIEMKNASLRVSNREPDIEDAEGGRGHSKEVHGRDGPAVVAQEREPALEGARRRSSSRKTPGHAALRDFEAEHAQLAVDARRTPGRVLQCHLMYQGAQAGLDWRSTSTAAPREPGPIATKTGLVPADHCLGFDEDEHLGPSQPNPPQGEPEQSVGGNDAGTLPFSCKHGQLLPKR